MSLARYLSKLVARLSSDGKVPTSALGAGAVLQVAQAIKTDTFTSTSGSWTDVTGLSVSITPLFATSKILVITSLAAHGATTTGCTGRVVRDSTAIGVAASAGSRSAGGMGEFYTPRTDQLATYTSTVLDAPATTSALTYKVQVISGSNGGYQVSVNRTYDDSNSVSITRGASSITVMEIAA